MPRGLQRFQQSGQSHFVTFSCYRRQPYFEVAEAFDLFLACLEEMRCRFEMCIYGYVVMPEHVHLLLSEPTRATLADALHFLKLSFAKRLRSRRPERPAGAETLLRPQRERLPRVRNQAALPAQEPGETRTGYQPGGMEVEQLSSLPVARNGCGRDRVRVDGSRS